MPGGDGTGPVGMGPMTGRAAGFCAGYGVPGYVNSEPGYGFRGRGGRGRRNWFSAAAPGWPGAPYAGPVYGGTLYTVPAAPAMPREQEIEMLKARARYAEESLGRIRSRIEELDQTEQKR
jgi:hypothetical protein